MTGTTVFNRALSDRCLKCFRTVSIARQVALGDGHDAADALLRARLGDTWPVVALSMAQRCASVVACLDAGWTVQQAAEERCTSCHPDLSYCCHAAQGSVLRVISVVASGCQ
eukprot:401906-Alexandrium_andersonii.AAC.1